MEELKNLQNKTADRLTVVLQSPCVTLIKLLIAVWVLSGDSLSLILSGYVMDIPIFKYIFTAVESIDGWGIENIFIALGLGYVFYTVRDRKNNRTVSVLSVFYAICTVVGISYSKTDSWDCIFLFGTQFVLAVMVIAGYYFLYKNCILFIIHIVEKNKGLFRTEPSNRFEKLLFAKYSFVSAFILLSLCSVPWVISFFPGSIQPDSYVQLLMRNGVFEYTGHFPVGATEVLYFFVKLGEIIFGSTAAGVFLFTALQCIVQNLVFSYSIYLMKYMGTPIVIRIFALCFYGLSPLFQIWGITFGKDSMYYICFLLLLCAIIDILEFGTESYGVRKTALMILACIGMCTFRNDGIYVVSIILIGIILSNRKKTLNFILCLAISCLVVFMVKSVYMPVKGIPDGPVGEMLSVPLQQTARYLVEYPDDVTEDERSVLQTGFEVDINEIADLYNPVLSDPVKAAFVDNPPKGYLKDYFVVWAHQLLRHPDSYIQAFFNQTYGYFWPGAKDGKGEEYYFYIVYAEEIHDEVLNVKYSDETRVIRKLLENYGYTFEKVPVIGMILSPGIYVYLLLGAIVILMKYKKRDKMYVFMSMIVILLVCLVSPVNGCIRYMLPIMAAMPLGVSWFFNTLKFDLY